jgi:hypothetical protein
MAIDREDRMRKIQALLDKAANTGFTEEAHAAQQKAEELMLSWEIEQFELDQVKPKHEREKPTHRRVNVCGPNNPLRESLVDLFSLTMRHVHVSPVYYMGSNPKASVAAEIIGFPSDLDYAEMLYTSLQMQMLKNLEPEPDPTLSFEENLVLLKEAGMKWQRLHEVLRPDVPWERKHGVRYTGIYTRYCEENNQRRMYTSPVTYQRNFSEGFVAKVRLRLAEIKARMMAQTHQSDGSLVPALRNKDQDVKSLLIERHPKLGVMARRGPSKFDAAAHSRGSAAGDRADLGQTRVGSRKELD